MIRRHAVRWYRWAFGCVATYASHVASSAAEHRVTMSCSPSRRARKQPALTEVGRLVPVVKVLVALDHACGAELLIDTLVGRRRERRRERGALDQCLHGGDDRRRVSGRN